MTIFLTAIVSFLTLMCTEFASHILSHFVLHNNVDLLLFINNIERLRVKKIYSSKTRV